MYSAQKWYRGVISKAFLRLPRSSCISRSVRNVGGTGSPIYQLSRRTQEENHAHSEMSMQPTSRVSGESSNDCPIHVSLILGDTENPMAHLKPEVKIVQLLPVSIECMRAVDLNAWSDWPLNTRNTNAFRPTTWTVVRPASPSPAQKRWNRSIPCQARALGILSSFRPSSHCRTSWSVQPCKTRHGHH